MTHHHLSNMNMVKAKGVYLFLKRIKGKSSALRGTPHKGPLVGLTSDRQVNVLQSLQCSHENQVLNLPL